MTKPEQRDAVLKVFVQVARDILADAPVLEAYMKERLEYVLQLAAEIEQRTCAWFCCSEPFAIKQPNQRYCSTACSRDAIREKKRTWWNSNRGRNAKRAA